MKEMSTKDYYIYRENRIVTDFKCSQFSVIWIKPNICIHPSIFTISIKVLRIKTEQINKEMDIYIERWMDSQINGQITREQMDIQSNKWTNNQRTNGQTVK